MGADTGRIEYRVDIAGLLSPDLPLLSVSRMRYGNTWTLGMSLFLWHFPTKYLDSMIVIAGYILCLLPVVRA